MQTLHVLISLVGSIALLTYGIQLVSGGMQRALGDRLRTVLALGLNGRVRALVTGLGITMLLQSSTATALMATSLTATGAMALGSALALMLGANIGTTLIVQLASLDTSMIYPLLILVGLLCHRKAASVGVRAAGLAVLGLGLVLLALHVLVATMAPIETSVVLRDFLSAATIDPIFCIVMAALISWAAHSSVAAMLFVMSLAVAGVITPQASFAMVLGANLGSALNPLLASLGQEPARRRLPIGNLFNRIVGCLLALPLIGPLSSSMTDLMGGDSGQAAALFHLGFNVAMAAFFLPLLPLVEAGLKRVMPEPVSSDGERPTLYLDKSALSTPTVALANAAREVLRMADAVEAMLERSGEAFASGDLAEIASIRSMDDTVDRLFRAIQLYLGGIDGSAMTLADRQRLSETVSLAINLEHIGDLVDRNVMDLAERRCRHNIPLPETIRDGVAEMYERMVDHLHLAVTVFMFADREAARRLVAGKEEFRAVEQDIKRTHLRNLQKPGQSEFETSALYIDLARDLKRIVAHLAATAHGLLEQAGELRDTRLTVAPDGPVDSAASSKAGGDQLNLAGSSQ